MNIIIDERTGEEVKQFAEYLDAAVYRPRRPAPSVAAGCPVPVRNPRSRYPRAGRKLSLGCGQLDKSSAVPRR